MIAQTDELMDLGRDAQGDPYIPLKLCLQGVQQFQVFFSICTARSQKHIYCTVEGIFH